MSPLRIVLLASVVFGLAITADARAENSSTTVVPAQPKAAASQTGQGKSTKPPATQMQSRKQTAPTQPGVQSGVRTYPNGYTMPVDNGYSMPATAPAVSANGLTIFNNGYTQPVDNGYRMPETAPAGVANGVQTYSNGYTKPVKNGYTMPDAHYTPATSVQAGVANGVRSFDNGYTQPTVTAGVQNDTTTYRNGYSMPASNGYIESKTSSSATSSVTATNVPTNPLSTSAIITSPSQGNLTGPGNNSTNPFSGLPGANPAFGGPSAPLSTTTALSTPAVGGSVPEWLRASNLSLSVLDALGNSKIPLKLETYVDTQYGGVRVAEYRLSPSTSVDLNTFSGALKVAGDAATLISVTQEAKKELTSRGIDASSLVDAWISSPKSIVFAVHKPDATIDALTKGFTSTSAISIRMLTWGIVELTGPEIEQYIKETVAKTSSAPGLPSKP